jgi:hypothetical protein
LCGWPTNPESDVLFSGKIQKMVSVLASMAAAKFATVIPSEYEARLPHFDARVFQLPSQGRGRQRLPVARYGRPQERHQHGGPEPISRTRRCTARIRRPCWNAGRSWGRFRGAAGVLPARLFRPARSCERLLSDEEELARIPEKHRPSGPVMRSNMKVLDMPPFNKVANRVEVIFDGAAALS